VHGFDPQTNNKQPAVSIQVDRSLLTLLRTNAFYLNLAKPVGWITIKEPYLEPNKSNNSSEGLSTRRLAIWLQYDIVTTNYSKV